MSKEDYQSGRNAGLELLTEVVYEIADPDSTTSLRAALNEGAEELAELGDSDFSRGMRDLYDEGREHILNAVSEDPSPTKVQDAYDQFRRDESQ